MAVDLSTPDAKECKAVLDDLISRVEQACGVELAKEIKREAVFLDDLAKRASLPDKHVHMVLARLWNRLNKNKAFAARMCATGHASHFFAAVAETGSFFWPLCFNNVINKVSAFPDSTDIGSVCAPLVRWGTHEDMRVAESSFSALRKIGQVAKATVEDMDEVVSLLGDRIGDDTAFTCYIFDLLSDSRKAQ
eukprot:2767194-Prymnesium_polylepis.1